MATCRLCLRERELKKSHIIPEFVYSPLYDEKHRFHMLSSIGIRGPAKLQKGIREYLLCGHCEGVISKYERYMSLIISGQLQIKSSHNGKLVTLEGLDYQQFRLFGLSVLWRASVSCLQMFEEVKLGPHEEMLRQMIHTEDPGRPYQYPFMLAPLVHEGEVQTDLIMQPTWTRAEGHYGYRFVFGGLAWVFLVSSHKPPFVISNAAISEEGKTIMLISDIEKIPFITNFVRELVENGQLPESKC